MYRKIIWVPKVEEVYLSILDLWIEYNGSSAYSPKIIVVVETTEKGISEYPLIDPIIYEVPLKKVRKAVILYNFSLFYKAFPDKIEVVFSLGNRDNPKKLSF